MRRLRESAGRTQGDVGAAIGRTYTTLVNWERGKTKISKSDLVCLLAELRVPAEVRKGLEQLREESGQGGGQWAVYGLPGWLRPLVSFEEDAVAITSFEPVVVPGLLQTEDYARAIASAAPHATAPADVDKRVAARTRRQQRLFDTSPLRLHAVISESVLRLEVGGTAVTAAQLDRLVEAVRVSNVTIQVLPSTRGEYIGAYGNFTVLHFADPKLDPPLGYFDGPLGGYLIDDEGDVASMIGVFSDLRQAALPEEDSAEMLAAILEEHR